MNNNPYNYKDWKYLIPDIEEVIKKMDRTPILSVGITPYTRIIPSFFLKNYSIFSVRRSSDTDIMEPQMPMYVFEDLHPDVAARVHGTGFLVVNNSFQKILKSFSTQPLLMLNTVTEKLLTDMKRLRFPWIANSPATFNDVKYKTGFRKLLKEIGLGELPTFLFSKEEFSIFSFNEIFNKLGGSFVVQRGDKEVGGNVGTFFIHTEKDLVECINVLKNENDFNEIVVSPFVEGYSTSVLGCVLEQGTLTGPLQLQLIDVPESLNGVKGNGTFLGNDLGFKDWSLDIEKKAQKIVEEIGRHLFKEGYRGIFGIDFMYDKKRDDIFAIECNPRSPGSALLYSLSLLEKKIPPLEFFHLFSHLYIKSSFDFNLVNDALKIRAPYSHISFSPKDIPQMELSLLAGVYSYDETNSNLSYIGPGLSLADLKTKNDFLVIDTVPVPHKPIEQNVPRLFKLIFPYSIAKGTNEIEPRAAFLVDRFMKSLINAAKK